MGEELPFVGYFTYSDEEFPEEQTDPYTSVADLMIDTSNYVKWVNENTDEKIKAVDILEICEDTDVLL